MGCAESEGCNRGGCSGCCKNSSTKESVIGISSIVELEIHYSEIEGQEAAVYVFESLLCLTNIQTKETRVTGLEGRKFESLDEIRQHIFDFLLKTDDFTCGSITGIDFSYIKDDI